MDNFELRRRALLKNIAVSIVKLIVTGANGIVNFTSNLIHSVKIVCDFAPVQTGTGDPSPSNVRPISGYTGCDITKAGKNLFGGDIFAQAVHDVWEQTIQEDSNGKYWDKGIGAINTPMYFSNFFKVKENTQYTFLLDMVGSIQVGFFILHYTDGTDSIIQAPATRGVVRFVSNANKTISYFTIINRTAQSRIIYFGTSGVFEGEVAVTEFEPYTANILPVNWQTEAGTVYGGTLTINEDGTGRLVSEYKQISVGDLNYTLNTGLTYVDRYYVVISDSKSYGVSDLPDVICEAFKTMTLAQANSSNATWAFGFQSRTVYFYVPKDTYSTINDFKSAFASTKFVYALDTPVTYNLTASQVNSLLGTNNIWHNMNGSITVEYYNKQ